MHRPHYSESYFLSVMLASSDDRIKAVAIKLSQNTHTPFPKRETKSKAEYVAPPRAPKPCVSQEVGMRLALAERHFMEM